MAVVVAIVIGAALLIVQPTAALAADPDPPDDPAAASGARPVLVTRSDPVALPTVQGGVLVLHGSGLDLVEAVRIGGATVPILQRGAAGASISVVAPSAAPGTRTVEVVLEAPDGDVLLGDALRYVDAPGPPTGVRAVAGDASAELRWRAPALDGGADISGYLVEARGTDGTWAEVGRTTARTWDAVGIANGSIVHLRVAAIGPGGLGAPSGTVQARPFAFDPELVGADGRPLVEAHPGDAVVVVAAGLPPGLVARFEIPPERSTAAVVDPTGRLRLEGRLPLDAPPGGWSLVIGLDGDCACAHREVVRMLTVTRVPTAPSSTPHDGPGRGSDRPTDAGPAVPDPATPASAPPPAHLATVRATTSAAELAATGGDRVGAVLATGTAASCGGLLLLLALRRPRWTA